MTLYHIYGLALASDLDCPELTELTPDDVAARGHDTVALRAAQAPLSLPEGRQIEQRVWITPDAILYELAGHARILVERPDRITVELLGVTPFSAIRPFLYGTCFTALLHMRGLIPLHISAIRAPEGVLAFTGPSGAGKSTRVSELHFAHGWPLICDDLAVLHPGDARPLLHAGVNQIKLWRDAVERFGIDPARLTPDALRADKFLLIDPAMFVHAPQPLEVLTWIDDGTTGWDAAKPGMAVETLLNAIFLPGLAGLFGDRAKLARDCMRFAQGLELRSYPRQAPVRAAQGA